MLPLVQPRPVVRNSVFNACSTVGRVAQQPNITLQTQVQIIDLRDTLFLYEQFESMLVGSQCCLVAPPYTSTMTDGVLFLRQPSHLQSSLTLR